MKYEKMFIKHIQLVGNYTALLIGRWCVRGYYLDYTEQKGVDVALWLEGAYCVRILA